jgi:endonuclease YncB( thermonuclease family)
MRVTIVGKEERLRLCGIDAPELKQNLGEQSRNVLQAIVNQAGGKAAVVVTDRDCYGRLVAEVFVPAPQPGNPDNEKFLNYEMMQSGNAFAYSRCLRGCPDGQAIEQAEAEAKQAQVGVWQSADFQKPWDWRQANY